MLNYIWAGLIISSLLFAVSTDVGELNRDRYRNGEPLPVQLSFPEGYDPEARRVPVAIRIDPAAYAQFYRTEERPAESYTGYVRQTHEGRVLRFEAETSFPEPLATIAGVSKSRDDELQGELVGFTRIVPGVPAPTASAAVVSVGAGSVGLVL